MHHLSIDLETYSSVPLAKAGAQKYIQSPDFQILLFAYSVDGAPVEIIDLARGEYLPRGWSRPSSPRTTSSTHTTPPLSGAASPSFLGPSRPAQWRCTMFHGLCCGYTAVPDFV